MLDYGTPWVELAKVGVCTPTQMCNIVLQRSSVNEICENVRMQYNANLQY